MEQDFVWYDPASDREWEDQGGGLVLPRLDELAHGDQCVHDMASVQPNPERMDARSAGRVLGQTGERVFWGRRRR